MPRAPTKKEAVVAEIVDATLEEIYKALKRGECVSLKNFGTFYGISAKVTWAHHPRGVISSAARYL
ncbi:MAG: HU family DNA-binding protein [Chloroflexi bacterium]|nr:HU family DNA-binding protein [Chloroflexota bacterium]